MTTIAAGNSAEVYVPLASSMTFTPGTDGRIKFGCSTPNGQAAPAPREIVAAETVSIPAGSTLFLEAIDADATYTDPALTAQQVEALAAGAGGRYPALSAMGGLVAFWDFSEPRAPYYSKAGLGPFALRNGTGSRVAKGTSGPLSQSVVFNGSTDYLYIPAAEVGALNIGDNGGNAVTVIAWWKRSNSSSSDFIAGCWDEEGAKRQYGLFVDLPVYGGDNKVCFHVSKTGTATTGYEFNRDYANSSSTEPSRTGEWIAGTYDGTEARAYLEALFEPYPSFTDVEGQTYAKNPYAFGDGLNTVESDFHVGANPVDPTWNFAAGELGCLAVFNRALTQAEIAEFQAAVNPAAQGFRHTLHQWDQNVTGVSAIYGCNAYRGASAADESNSGTGVFLRTATGNPSQHFIYRSTTSSAGIALFTITNLPPDLTTDNLKTLTWQMANANTGDTVRFALRIGTTWYATEATFATTSASASGADWSAADTESITFTKAAASWRDLTLTPGSTLTLAGAARGSDLPDGAITGIGIYSPGVPTGNVRVRNFEVITL